jgi:diacylglycerol kinase (ATP)
MFLYPKKFTVYNQYMIHHRTLAKSFGYALEGVVWAFTHNQNLVIHFIVGSAVIICSFLLRLSYSEIVDLIIMILLVIAAEMVNSSIEQMTDLIVKEHRIEAKIAKDVAAGMVLVTSFGSVIVGLLILLPHILRLFR